MLKKKRKPKLKPTSFKKKVLITVGVLLLLRLGSQIPTYGVDVDSLASFMESNAALSFLNSLTGNSFESLSIFALSITPYITGSIVIQLLTVVIPALEEMSKDGPVGQKKLEKIIYVTGGIMGYVEGICMAIGFGKQDVFTNDAWYIILIAGLIWGTCALISIALGKFIDNHGVGNGISLILLTNIVSSLPSDFYSFYEYFCEGRRIPVAALNVVIITVGVVLIFLFAMLLNNAEKRVPVVYSGKIAGGRTYKRQDSFIPIKLLVSGVLPVIFASSLMSFPGIIAAFVSSDIDGIPSQILAGLTSSNWFSPTTPVYTFGYLVYVLLVIFFGYFYTPIAFNTYEIAENLRKSGGTIPGIRPGKPTAEYLDRKVRFMIFIGTIGLLILATVPFLVAGIYGISSLSFGGTSILIIVSVIFETRKDIETERNSGKALEKMGGLHAGGIF